MTPQEYVAYLEGPTGRFVLQAASDLLQHANPETDDADLLKQVMGLGFPQWAAVRIFKTCTNRFAPLTCRSCERQFKPRSVWTMDRPYCNQCVNPVTPEQEIKIMANRAAMTARTNGKLKRKPCEECGAKYNVHMHHPDYSRPLFVKWLCTRCHKAEHKKLSSSG